jgi:MerR family transcriptional regulator/heat shock protein HspR
LLCSGVDGWRKTMAKGKSRAAYMISAVAERYEIHPQTLRLYEREGLLAPSRSDGNTRLYTDEDLERLEVILKLTRELGVNLAGVEIILNMRQKMEAMQQQIETFVANLNQEFAQHTKQVPEEEQNSLIPVIRMTSLTQTRLDSRRTGEVRRKHGRQS